MQDAGFGHSDGRGADAGIGGDVDRRPAFDDGQPKCLPSPVLEFTTDEIQGPPAQAVQFLDRILILVAVVGHGLESEMRICPSHGIGETAAAAKVLQDHVPRDPPEPAAERIARPVAPEGIERSGRGSKDLLAHVLAVRPAHSTTATPMMHQRAVQLHHDVPGVAVIGSQPVEQGQRRGLLRPAGGRSFREVTTSPVISARVVGKLESQCSAQFSSYSKEGVQDRPNRNMQIREDCCTARESLESTFRSRRPLLGPSRSLPSCPLLG